MPKPEQTPEPQVHRGDAADPLNEQLPMGAAQQVQAQTDEAERMQAQTDAEQAAITAPPEEMPATEDASAPEGVQLERGGGRHQRESFADDDEAFLYGPTVRPNEPVFAGTRLGHKAPPPTEIMNWVPYLLEAANQPDAPQELRDLLREIVFNLGG